MNLGLDGKTAFVSGSTRGIGYAVAAALLREGVRVTISGRSQAGVDRAAAGLRAEVDDADVAGVVVDFGHPDAVRRLTASLEDVDILVNNVGLFDVAPFDSLDDDAWQRYFEVNVMSGVRLSRRLLPGMLDRGWGRIVFVGSESGVNVPADMIHYGATKAAMLALGNGLAKLTRGTAVTVNSVLGGPTFSDGVADAVDAIADAQGMDAAELKAAIAAGHPTSLVRRFLAPDEIASLVVYLASPVASATNGAALRADGGALTATL